MKQTSSSIGFPAVLTIVFVILKVTHVVAWSWWWVFAPLWISFGFSLIIAVLIGVAMALRGHHV